MKMKKSNWKDWIDVIIIGIMICCVVIAIQYYFNIKARECIREPLVYAAKYYEETYGYPFRGSGYFIMEQSSPIIYFDSYGVTSKAPSMKDILLNTYFNIS